ncbi:MAG: hypothetical protein GX321_10840 [Clostridiales bacterium]|nr:hypothetical protein [Clostridiales bacterium]
MELIIAVVIAGIVLLMIMTFVNSASNSFKLANEEVNIQIEAQTIINQLSNLAMEAMDMESHTDLTGNKRFIFKYAVDDYYVIVIDEEELYQIKASSLEDAKENPYNKEDHFLAEYVYQLDIEKTSNDDAVVIDLTLSFGSDRENMIKTVKFRNHN